MCEFKKLFIDVGLKLFLEIKRGLFFLKTKAAPFVLSLKS